MIGILITVLCFIGYIGYTGYFQSRPLSINAPKKSEDPPVHKITVWSNDFHIRY